MAESIAGSRFSFGSVVVEPRARRVVVDGKAAKLGGRAFDVLLALIERRDRVVGKNELLDVVWSGLVVEENNLQVHISALRKLLGPLVIATIPGRGYRFTAAIDGEDDVRGATTAAASPIRPLEPGNLPQHLPPLYGRDDDLKDLVALVRTHPLVTLVGPAGVGKTTLALAAALALRGHWVGGAWIAELAHVDDPCQLPQAVARPLHVVLHGPGTPLDQLVNALQAQTLLLVLDNCEHVASAAGALAAALVARAPGVRVLATSQDLLSLPGEQLYRLQPLALPGPAETAGAARYGAIDLFVERARLVDPRFALDAGNAQAVSEICRQLDGLPLAIELAAARVRLLGVQGLRDRLGERFRVLTGGARTAMPRHQTLHAALDWSHALLSATEQTVLRRLGVFVDGFTLALAQQVASDEQIDEWAALDALSALADKSWLMTDGARLPRYRLLQTTRAYALERLADAGELPALTARHAHAICDLFARTEESRFGERGTLSFDDFMARLVPELDNLRAALRWSMGPGGAPVVAIALASASAVVFRTLGLSQEALAVMKTLQGRVDELATRECATVFWYQLAQLGSHGRLPRATVLDAYARAARSCRGTASRRRIYQVLCGTAWTLITAREGSSEESLVAAIAALERPAWPAWLRGQRRCLQSALCNRHGRFEEALGFLTEEQALLEQAHGEEVLLLNCLANQCFKLLCLERYADAVEAAHALVARTIRNPLVSVGLGMGHLTLALTCLGRLDEADRTMRQAMPGWLRDGTLAWVCAELAPLLAEQGRLRDAVKALGAASEFIRRMEIEEPQIVATIRRRLQRAFDEAALKPADIEQWQAEGARLDERALAALCLGGGTDAAKPPSALRIAA